MAREVFQVPGMRDFREQQQKRMQMKVFSKEKCRACPDSTVQCSRDFGVFK